MVAAIMRVMVALQLLLLTLFATASPIDGSSLPTKREVTLCTQACWTSAIEATQCTSESTDAMTSCMCTTFKNYMQFYDCNLECYHKKEYDGLTDNMKCVGVHYKNLARDVDNLIVRAADPQIAALTPWKTEEPKPKKPKPEIYSTYHHISFPATWGLCGVPGASCNNKIVDVEAGSVTTTLASGETIVAAIADDEHSEDDDSLVEPPMPGSGVVQTYSASQPTTFQTMPKIGATLPVETGSVQKRKATSMTPCSSATSSEDNTVSHQWPTVTPDVCEMDDICGTESQ